MSAIDFCFAYDEGSEISIQEYLYQNKMIAEFCGLMAMKEFANCFVLYYDLSHKNGMRSRGFKGIGFDEGGHIILSEIPRDMVPITIVHYDQWKYQTEKNGTLKEHNTRN